MTTIMDKIISFDMDGTLIHQSFADAVWLEGLPHRYAQHRGISFLKAKKILQQEYNKIGPGALEWYDLQYWHKKLGLDDDWESLLDEYHNKITLYPEVQTVLQTLKKNYSLIIISNAAQEFLAIELKTTNIAHYFSHIFSAVTDFHTTKKDITVYQEICNKLSMEPTHLIHVGDDYYFDYRIPKKIGILAFYLNRNPSHHQGNTHYTLTHLGELSSKI